MWLNYTLSHYVVGKVDLTCPADPNGSCEISSLLGGEEEIISMAPKMGINEAAVNFTCSGDPADMTYDVVASNISQDTLTDISYDLNLYSDSDGNGELNPVIDALLGATNRTINGTFFPGDNQTISGTFQLYQLIKLVMCF